MKREAVSGRVSLVVPCYNTDSYVQPCLDSLISQTYLDIEIIVVDDSSTDTTWSRIQTWMDRIAKQNLTFPLDERFFAIRLPRNAGFAGAVTTGMYLARGEFIAMQDSDDLSHPERIKYQVNAMRQRSELDLVGTSYQYFKDGRFENREREQWLKYGSEKIKAVYKNGGHCVCHGTILFRSALFNKLGGPTRRIEGAEDYDFIARCISSGVTVDNLKKPLYYYRIHDKQRSKEYYGN